MPSFKNVSGVRLDLPALDVHVDPDGVFEVADEGLAAGLALQSAFEAVDGLTPAVTVPPAVAPAVPAPPAPAPAADVSVDFAPSN